MMSVTTLTEPARTIVPPAPPPIPLLRRATGVIVRFWPWLAWLLLLGVVGWLYLQEPAAGQARAHASYTASRVIVPIDGRLASLTVGVGDEVRAGQIVGSLDLVDLEARLKQATAKLGRSKTRITAAAEELRLEFVDRKTQAEARRMAYEAEGRRLRGLLAQLAGEDARDRAEVAGLLPEIERLTALREQKLAKADGLEELKRTRSVLEQTTASRAVRLEAARAELLAWRGLAPEPPRQPDDEMRLLPIRLQVSEQELRVAELELEREKHTLIAPVTGRVSRIDSRPGEWCVAGMAVIEIIVPEPGHLTAYLTGTQITNIRIGTEVVLRIEDGGAELRTGRVTMIGPRVELVPEQLRAVAKVPEWGRMVKIVVEDGQSEVPGQVYAARFL